MHSLDAWRGIAALLVALHRLEADGWLHSLSIVKNSYLFVDFFFVLSGFVIAYAYLGHLGTGKTTLIFLVRRFGRVWPLHITLMLIFVALELLSGLYSIISSGAFNAFSGYRSPITIIWDTLLIQALGFTGATGWNTPAWSISTEFWTYVCFALLCFGGRRFIIVVSPLIIAVCIALVAQKSSHGMGTTFDYGFMRCLAGFFSGVTVQVIYKSLREKEFNWNDKFGITELITIVFTALFVSFAGHGWLSFLAPIAFAPLVFIFAFERGAISKIMSGIIGQLLGKLSYSIYMTALIISLFFNKIAIAVNLKLGFNITTVTTTDEHSHRVYSFGTPILNDAYTIIYLASVILISWLSCKYIENPTRLFFNQFSKRIQ